MNIINKNENQNQSFTHSNSNSNLSQKNLNNLIHGNHNSINQMSVSPIKRIRIETSNCKMNQSSHKKKISTLNTKKTNISPSNNNMK